MRIAVLGSLEVLTDDLAPVPVPGAKERLILAVLTAAAPGVVSVDRLVEAVWDGAPPATARKSLQAHLVRLRTALEPGRPRGSSGRYVVRRGCGYALAVERHDLDALRIGDLAAHGRAQLASGRPADAVQDLTAALDLWRGEPYADWPDALFAETERRRLAEVRSGAIGGLVEAHLALGQQADVIPELEALVVREPLQENWWRLLVLALYRDGRQADALAAARRARALLREELGAEPGPALREAAAAVLRQDPALDRPTGRAPPVPVEVLERNGPVSPTCPYKGLAAYQVDDAVLFHGRDRLVAELVARLVDAPLVVVSGPSGAGKSSLVRAGLIPALLAGSLPGSATWEPVVLAPEDRPVDALAGLTGDSPPEKPVFLVCDQFERLWAPGIDPAERVAFLDTVLGLLDDGIVVRCVLSIRGDHVGRLAEHPVLAGRLGGALVLVPALTDGELRAIVREPARAVGLTADPELVDAVVSDVLGRVGALPLLSTALVGTWQRRSGRHLTLGGYLAAGGVSGALTRSAEAAYAVLDDAGREDARHLLVRLADVDDGGALVRRPVPLAELDLDGERGPGRRAVVEAFVDRRLLAVDGDRLEVAHEALLTGWPRLVGWLEDDAAGRAIRRRLVPAARDWAGSGRPDGELYRGPRLAAALDWAAQGEADLTPSERDFLEASQARATAELDEARRRADHEAAARRRTRRLAAGLAAVLVLALVAAGLALRAQGQAARASLVADANRLAALSTTARSLDLSLLLAVQAARLVDTPEAQDALLTALSTHDRAERVGAFSGNAIAPQLAAGRTLFFGTGDQIITWSIGPSSQPRPPIDIPVDWTAAWSVAAPSPVEDLVLAAGGDGGPASYVRLVSADLSSRLLQQGSEVGGLPLAGAFSPDGRRVRLVVAIPDAAAPRSATRWTVTDVDAVDGKARPTGIGGTFPAPAQSLAADFADDGGSAVLWDREGTAPAVLVGLDGASATLPEDEQPALDYLALSSGAARLADDGGIALVDRAGVEVQRIDVHQQPVRDVVLSPDGTWAVTAGDGGAVVVWDVDASTGRWSQREVLSGHDGDVIGVEVDPAGRRLVTVSLDHTIISWDMSPEGGFGPSYPALDGRWISNRPVLVAPDLLVAPTRPGTPIGAERDVGPGPETLSVAATFLDPESGRLVDQEVVGDTVPGIAFGSSVSVSPDGALVAVTWGLGTTVLDTGTRDVVEEIVLPATGGRDREGNLLPAGVVWCSGWTPDGTTLLLCAGDGTDGPAGSLVPVDTGTWQIGDPIDIGGSAQVIETGPDDRLLAVASLATSAIVLLDTATLEVERTVTVAPEDQLGDLSFSPDGGMLAAIGARGQLHVLDTRTWRPVREPALVHDASGLQVEWLPDGRTIATTGMDGTVSLFDVDRGLLRARPLPASGEPGEGYAHLVPGAREELLVLAGHRTGRRYPLQASAWLDQACAIVGRDLTQAEWDRYLPGRSYEPTCSDRS